jgi:hypothetical protein
MIHPIWRDRVWLSLLLGPFVWTAVVMAFMGWPQEGVQLLAHYAQGMCISVAAVSVFLPLIRGSAGHSH